MNRRALWQSARCDDVMVRWVLAQIYGKSAAISKNLDLEIISAIAKKKTEKILEGLHNSCKNITHNGKDHPIIRNMRYIGLYSTYLTLAS